MIPTNTTPLDKRKIEMTKSLLCTLGIHEWTYGEILPVDFEMPIDEPYIFKHTCVLCGAKKYDAGRLQHENSELGKAVRNAIEVDRRHDAA